MEKIMSIAISRPFLTRKASYFYLNKLNTSCHTFASKSFSTKEIPPPPPLPGMTILQLQQIEEKDKYLREKHIEIEASLTPSERDEVRRKRMIYRSKQRGWLEVDILLGSFGAQFIPEMSSEELDEYELILKEETVDTFNYITGKDPLPQRLVRNSVMSNLQEYARTSKLTSPEAYAAAKTANNLI